MFLLVGSAGGLLFGLASAFANRLWGTILACVPITAWFIIFGFTSINGLQDSVIAPLCYGLLGIVLGVFIGQLFDRQNRRRAKSAN